MQTNPAVEQSINASTLSPISPQYCVRCRPHAALYTTVVATASVMRSTASWWLFD